jgi:uncharacterized protein (TIGR03435 family)
VKKLLLLAAVLASATLTAQPLDVARDRQAAPPALTFEVASVKRNVSGDTFISFGMQPGRLTLINIPARQLIVRAYQVQPYQVLGGPSWITGDRFDVTAKVEGEATPQQMNVMLQSLLADRFRLKVHKETRQSDVFRLVKARADGKLGEALKPAAVDCSAGRGRPGGAPGGCFMMIAPGRLQLAGQPISSFVNSLAGQLGRPVLDGTGLTGPYDLIVSFMPDSSGRGGPPPGPPPPGAPELPPIDPNAPALPTALLEQLGLRLEPTKGPVEMIVIDSIDQPTED